MNHMLYVLSFFVLSLFACKKDSNSTDTEDLYKDAPRSELPADLAPASWQYGSVSALGIYNDRGNHVANSEEALREYKVTKDGYVEFVQYLSVAGTTCYQMTYTHLKGTMKWEAPNKIIWTPVEGEFDYRSTCSGAVSTRKADQDDLNRIKSVYWYKWDDFGYIGGKKYLVLYTDPSLDDRFKVFAYDVIK